MSHQPIGVLRLSASRTADSRVASFPDRRSLVDGGPVKENRLTPYLTLAGIVQASLPANEDRFQNRVVERAKWLGAVAVIVGKVDVFESMGWGPLCEFTVNQAGHGYHSYAWGLGAPRS